MKRILRIFASSLAMCVMAVLLGFPPLQGQNSSFHNAPASARQLKNPYVGQAQAGKPLYHLRCARCHGENGEGSGNIPSLAKGSAQSASDGELFWYITRGDVNNGMPSWASLPRQQRWQIVGYVRALPNSKALSASAPASSVGARALNAPLPKAPFTDYRFEKPGTVRKITLKDLPSPFMTPSAGNGPKVVPRPENAWPQVPPGFKVEQYASGLDELLRMCALVNLRRSIQAGRRPGFTVMDTISSAGSKPSCSAVFPLTAPRLGTILLLYCWIAAGAVAQENLPPSIETKITAGVQALKAGDLDSAEETFSDVLRQGIKHPLIYHNLGVIAQLRGRHAEACRAIS